MIQGLLLGVSLIAPLIAGVLMGTNGYGWYYFLTVFTFYICFGIFEALSCKFRKKAISKDIASTPIWLFSVIIGTWLIMNGGLIVHWTLMR